MTAMLEIKGVHKDFVKRLDMAAKIAARLGADVKEEVVHAVDNVTMDVAKGEVVGLVGESASRPSGAWSPASWSRRRVRSSIKGKRWPAKGKAKSRRPCWPSR